MTRPRSPLTLLCLTLTLLAATGSSHAHDPSPLELARLSRLVSEQAENPAPLIERASLYRHIGLGQLALKDLQRAEALEGERMTIERLRAEVLMDLSRPQQALRVVEQALTRPSGQQAVPLMLIRARLLHRLGRGTQAAEAYQRLLASPGQHPMEWYLEQAELLAGLGRQTQALEILDTAIRVHGPNAVLQLRAADLEERLGRYRAALARIEFLRRKAQRKDSWLAREAALLEKAGAQEQALQRYRLALQHLQALPERLRRLPGSLALEQQLNKHLKQAIHQNGQHSQPAQSHEGKPS